MLVLGSALFTGCHNRAYNDLYVESMAAEIRDLEDQLYEYDHEYRVLEQKLAALQAENNQHSSAVPQKAPKATDPLPGIDFQPRPAAPLAPTAETIKKPQASQTPSILESPMGGDVGPIPEKPAAIPPTGTQMPSLDIQPSPSGNGGLGSIDNLPPPPTADPTGRQGIAPMPNAPGAEDDFDLDSMQPPTIELGEPMPPPSLLPGNGADNRRSAPEDDLEMNLARIEIPSQLAAKSGNVGQAQLTVAAEQVTDTRVVELAFHSSHSRSANFDDDAADDGLVLLLLPKNERGQMVPVSAALSIVVLDPAREGAAARIGRWDYSSAEVKQKLEPLGTNQGIGLTLPWNGPNPSADRVIVFARYTFENGRQVIGQKEIFVTNQDRFKTVWAPRGNSQNNMTAGQSDSTPVGSVAHASHSTASINNTAEPSHIVRPASGTTTLDPAPSPLGSFLPR